MASKSAETMPVQRYDVQRPDGQFDERYWSTTNTPVADQSGAVRYIIHSVDEVTALVMLEKRAAERDQAAAEAMREEHERLVESNNALAATNEELEAFCYSVAHDLRAPLRGIQGFSQALLEDYSASVDEKGQGYLQRVSSAALRMSELIDDLLTLSRISRSPVTRVDVDVSSLARETAADQARHYKHHVEMTIGDGLHAHADARLVQIVLENLLGNAFKFTSKIAAARVTVGSVDTENGRAFFVRDNGAGFDEGYASKLFAPFQRLHSEKEFSGTGIGLATVQRIVRRHGGRAWARSAVDQGTTIYFTLPD
jgi:light-regulated signal transduction histidine kinase (bacteriophytochrome)